MQKHRESISIEQAKEYLREIECQGYIETRGYVLTLDGTDLNDYTKEKLLDLIEDEYYINKFFDKEQLIQMWLQETSKEDAVRELMMVTDPHVELLELEFEQICTCEDNKVIIAAYKGF